MPDEPRTAAQIRDAIAAAKTRDQLAPLYAELQAAEIRETGEPQHGMEAR